MFVPAWLVSVILIVFRSCLFPNVTKCTGLFGVKKTVPLTAVVSGTGVLLVILDPMKGRDSETCDKISRNFRSQFTYEVVFRDTLDQGFSNVSAFTAVYGLYFFLHLSFLIFPPIF